MADLLWLILPFAFLWGVWFLIKKSKSDSSKKEVFTKEEEAFSGEVGRKNKIGKYYRLKNRFFVNSEKYLFDELQRQNNNRYIILSKVRMEDLVNVVDGLDRKRRYGLRSRIKSRHIDFVILSKVSFNILVVIELDGKTHYWPSAKKGDDLKNEIFSNLNVKFYRIKVGENYATRVSEVFNSLS